MSEKYIRPVPDEVDERLKYFSREGLEIYIADLFQVFEPMGWQVHLTREGGDMGGDVVLTNRAGTRYIIQAKTREVTTSAQNAVPIREALAAKPIYKAHYAIAVTNTDDFSKDAKELATANGVILWRKAELQVLYEASKARDERPLAKLRLEIPKAEQPRRSYRWLLAPAGLLALLVVGFGLYSLAISYSGLRETNSIRKVLEGYDQAYRIAMNTNNTAQLEEYASERVVNRVNTYVQIRADKGCILETVELAPPSKIESRRESTGRIIARVTKSWKQTLRCPNKAAKVFDGPFTFSYTLENDGAGWKVVDSQPD